MPLNLIEPENDDEIFDSDEDALAYNAVMTGDVFRNVAISGYDNPCTVMIAGHPCTIRRGATLVERIPCVIVSAVETTVPYRRWPRGDWNKFFIPESIGIGAHVASLDELVTVASSELSRERRAITLTPHGVITFQQRLIHSLTRFVASEKQLLEVSGPVLQEAELERDWIEGRVDAISIEDAVEEFDNFMSSNNRRSRLEDPVHASELRREVRGGIRNARQ